MLPKSRERDREIVDVYPMDYQDDRAMRVSTLYLQGYTSGFTIAWNAGGIAASRTM
jgi:hypothetical protein